MVNEGDISAIGAPAFSEADATNPPSTPIQPNNDTSKPTIQVAPSEAASDSALVADLTRLVNSAYGEAEQSIYKAAFERTSTSEIKAHLRAGELAVAFLQPTGDSQPGVGRGKLVGCVYIKRLSATTGEFGMLAVDPSCRGTGLGRDLVGFAEERCRRVFGVAVMRLELLVPLHFEHVGKTRLQGWYTRLGYVMTELGDFGEAYPRLNALLAGPTEYRVFEKGLVG